MGCNFGWLTYSESCSFLGVLESMILSLNSGYFWFDTSHFDRMADSQNKRTLDCSTLGQHSVKCAWNLHLGRPQHTSGARVFQVRAEPRPGPGAQQSSWSARTSVGVACRSPPEEHRHVPCPSLPFPIHTLSSQCWIEVTHEADPDRKCAQYCRLLLLGSSFSSPSSILQTNVTGPCQLEVA